MLDLKFLGLTAEDIKVLRDLARTQHPKGGMQTAMGCVCGASGGGPAGSLACRVLDKLMDAGREARMERPPRRDPSVCDHHFKGSPRIWEYQGDTLCELCGSKV